MVVVLALIVTLITMEGLYTFERSTNYSGDKFVWKPFEQKGVGPRRHSLVQDSPVQEIG